MTPVVAARGGFKAHQDSVRLATPELIKRLRGLLGARLVAYLGGVKETRAVRQWVDGDRVPSHAATDRLRVAYQVAALLAERDSPAVAQAWFQGMNPELDDVAPARLLRDGSLHETAPVVLAAARAFAAAG